MILQSLARLAQRENLLGDPDFEWKGVGYLLRVGEGGRFLGLQTTKEAPAAVGKRKPKPVAKRFRVPREKARAAGDRAFFFYDKAEYALGLDPEPDPAKRRPAEKLAKRSGLFRDRVRECAEATGDAGANAVLTFLERVAEGQETVALPEDCAGNDLIAFTFAPDDGGLVTDRPAIRAYWQGLRSQTDSTAAPGFLCLVTGETVPEPGNHPQLKVPGGVPSGSPLVSFNQRAFESQGWKGNENAAVSRWAAEAYTTALKRLLDRAPPHPTEDGVTLPRRNLSLSSDTTVCYWSEASEPSFADFLAPLVEANEEKVKDLYQGIWQGRRPNLSSREAGAFYGLVLSGAQGRVVVRSWFETTVEEAVGHLARYFADLKLAPNAPPFKDGSRPPAIPLRRLLESLAPLGKREHIPPHLGAQLFEAALQGRNFPLSLLQRALTRARAEVTADSWADRVRRDARTALIKGVLIRNFHKEISPLLEPTKTDPGYLLGRLMAVLEHLQRLALGEVNANVVDRYFSSASATPRAVFVRLLKGARHHARKARDEDKNKGKAHYLENLIDTICDHFDVENNGFPAHLGLEQQGLFVLGYHQQRHDFFRSKQDRAASQPSTEEVL